VEASIAHRTINDGGARYSEGAFSRMINAFKRKERGHDGEKRGRKGVGLARKGSANRSKAFARTAVGNVYGLKRCSKIQMGGMSRKG